MRHSQSTIAANPESRWFGFRRVTPEQKTSLVRDVFASVAGRYDLMNDLMSGGLHRLWKNRLVKMINPKAGQVIVDVAGGTGDIALRCVRLSEGLAKVIVCDLSTAMLAEGRMKMVDSGLLGGIDWMTGNAENLPLRTRSADVYCIAFGLRNVTHIDKALAEAVRILKPGGRFFCLEFSPGVTPKLKPLYDRYCGEVLPRLGAWVAHDGDSYRYLAESIRKFPTQAALARRMKKAGLSQVKWHNLTGGIAVIHEGWRI